MGRAGFGRIFTPDRRRPRLLRRPVAIGQLRSSTSGHREGLTTEKWRRKVCVSVRRWSGPQTGSSSNANRTIVGGRWQTKREASLPRFHSTGNPYDMCVSLRQRRAYKAGCPRRGIRNLTAAACCRGLRITAAARQRGVPSFSGLVTAPT